MSSSARFLTFGCRLNSFETEIMRNFCHKAGLENTIVINTCAVTAEAERKARQAIRRERRLNPKARILVTGCSAQLDPSRYANMAEVDHVFGNDEKMRAETFHNLAASENAPRVEVGNIMEIEKTAHHLLTGFGSRTRAFVEIQQGCDHRCTFCVIPLARGRNRSVPIGEMVSRIRTLVEAGAKEVVLTGVDITGYGSDLPGQPTLGQACRRFLALVPELERLRLSSIDIAEIDEDFWILLENEPRLMPHLHLSLQAGDDLILKRMKRRHTRAQAIAFSKRAKQARPDLAFGADLIAGFPTETDEMFRRTLDLVDEAEIAYTHVFRYSSRPGTPAAKMPQVPASLRDERAQRLRERGEQSLHRFFSSLMGTHLRVLIEENKEGQAKGHSDEFAPILIDSHEIIPGTIVTAKATRHFDGHLIGEIS